MAWFCSSRFVRGEQFSLNEYRLNLEKQKFGIQFTTDEEKSPNNRTGKFFSKWVNAVIYIEEYSIWRSLSDLGS